MKIVTILGTRPEIIKLSALLPLLDKNFEHVLVHTGQHYDHNMDGVFFEELQLRAPDYVLGVGSHLQGKQTALMLEKIEEVLLKEKPNRVIVQGDTNTTLAGALAAAKLHVPVVHVEAGCRSFNRQMPEEINRVIADHVASYLIAPDKQSYNQLLSEGISAEKIFELGSTAFDAVVRNKEFAQIDGVLDEFGLVAGDFILVTIHRAENTDSAENLRKIIAALNELSNKVKIVFPMHPRTKKALDVHGITVDDRVQVILPQAYLSFLALLSACRFCISDSGGIQEEALACNVPCLIPRKETEWQRIVDAGKNLLMGIETGEIVNSVLVLLDEAELRKIKNIEFDFAGGVSKKIVEVLRGGK